MPPSSYLAPVLSIFASAALVRATAAAPPITITVASGPHDRQESVIRFVPPRPLAPPLSIVDRRGRRSPAQLDAEGGVSFVLDRLAAGRKARFTVEEGGPDAGPPSVEASRRGAVVELGAAGRPIARYQAEAALPRPDIDGVYLRGGYLHPLFTPSGAAVTDDYPPNHLHHHGVWSSWAATRFEGRTPDFWNMGKKNARTDFEALDATWSGPVHAGLRARHVHVELLPAAGKPVMRERWTVTVLRPPGGAAPYHLVDLDTITEAIEAPVVLAQHLYGGLGLRGAWAWNGKDAASFLTSEGKGRADGHASRARWCHLGGMIDGKPAGIAVLGHPENLRAPQPMRLHPTEPFFNFAPTQAAPFTLAPGKPLRARYRFVIHDGPPPRGLLDRLWNDYAHPAAVTVEGRPPRGRSAPGTSATVPW